MRKLSAERATKPRTAGMILENDTENEERGTAKLPCEAVQEKTVNS